MHNHDEHEHHHHHDKNTANIPANHMATCPVTGDAFDTTEAEKLGHFSDMDGKRIYLCCATCVRLFNESPDKYAPKLFRCPECELHYTDRKTAQECEAWCREHKSCNLEITKRSAEHQRTHMQDATGKQLVLSEKQHLADNIWSFDFTADQPLSWIPGQFIRLEVIHDSPDDKGTKRWFTISSIPRDGYIQVTTRITDTTFKQALAALDIGDKVRLTEQPDGDFIWQESAKSLVFVAGGIGITPFYSMLKARRHSSQPVSATLVYSGRTEDLPFKSELEETSFRHPEFKVEYVIGEQVTAEKLTKIVPDINASQVYISGPEAMVEALGKELMRHGLARDNLHQDFFPNYTYTNF